MDTFAPIVDTAAAHEGDAGDGGDRGVREPVRIESAAARSAWADSAAALADDNREFLGFLPRSAFLEYARDGYVLVAIDALGGSDVLGYVLFRVAFGRVAIAHLCVRTSARRRGVGRALIEAIVARYPDVSHVEARCRRDFAAHAQWPRLGFADKGEFPGRGRDRLPITLFVRSVHPDLFSIAQAADSRVRVALDTNVVIRLQDAPAGDDPVIEALRSDWLDALVRFGVTEETFNDFGNATEPALRARRRENAGAYAMFNANPQEVSTVYDDLRDVPLDDADRRHVACCVADGSVSAFVTDDEGVLRHAAAIESKSKGLRILRPAELIVELDSMERELEYAPARLEGTRITACRAASGDVPRLAQLFRSPLSDEPGSRLASELRTHMAVTESRRLRVVRTQADEDLAMSCDDVSIPGVHVVHLLRVVENQRRRRGLTEIVGRHLARSLVIDAARRRCEATIVIDVALAPTCRAALTAEGFLCVGKAWVHFHAYGVLTEADSRAEFVRISARLRTLPPEFGVHAGALDTELARLARSGAATIEDAAHPLKILDSSARTIVVPIQPRWAEHLFDAELSDQTLFGADESLMLAAENAYYRSCRGGPRFEPGDRILWYVSKDPDRRGTSSIRACSRVVSVEVGPPHVLFRRHRRLGVYSWNDVLRSAGGDPNGNAMAIRFDRSETFVAPVPLPRVQRVLGSSTTFPGPMAIDAAKFERIYVEGSRHP